MKRNLIYSILVSSLVLVGCSKEFLDPERNTSNLTAEDLSNYSDVNPALVEGTLEGIASFMIQDFGVTGSRHYDFGQKGVDIWSDMVSGDMALSASAYGWYNATSNLVCTVDFTREENKIIWEYYYRIVSLANNVIQTSGGNNAQPTTDGGKKVLGQAKASRAYAYWYLAQLFQKSYDPAQPILPYYDGETINTAKVPASQIYDLIISDLTDAIDLLDGYVRPDKSKIDQSVAQGLLAYVYAGMGNYADAKTMADAVIAAGYPLTTTGQLAFPGAGSGFNNVNTGSWVWGFDLTEELGHQLIDWWGQMDCFTYSYAWAGDHKSIDDALYAQIASDDVRKSQFGTGTGALQPIGKFFDPNRTIGGQYIITTDLIFMRSEEFHLLSAECAARLGDDASAKATMINLLDNRMADAAAVVNPLSGSALQDFIYQQTRIELWGEGKTYYAMKRNEATVTRGSNHVFRAGESFAYDSDEMSFQIPQSEINNNPSITDQN
jgi:starch-binding outer membrane protein, SusD/RagB family